MIRRVLLSNINADHQQLGQLRAFENIFGAENIVEYDYLELQRQGRSKSEINKGFIEVAREFSPDWIWLQVQECDVLQAATIMTVRNALPGCIVTHWMGDCREQVSPYLAAICRATHISLISNVGQIPMYLRAGGNDVRYLQIGLDWDEDVLGRPGWKPPFRVPEVVFCGNYNKSFPGTQDRLAGIRTLRDAGIYIGVVSSSGWPADIPVVGSCHVKQQHHIWKRAKICLNINHFNDIELYYSDRQIISMASGTPLVCIYVPGLEREFTNGQHCVWYKSLPELLASIRMLQSDPKLRAEIGHKGRALAMARHSWDYRIKDLLAALEGVTAISPTPILEGHSP